MNISNVEFIKPGQVYEYYLLGELVKCRIEQINYTNNTIYTSGGVFYFEDFLHYAKALNWQLISSSHQTSASCDHTFKSYVGFHLEAFDYCTKCDEKKETICA